MSEPKEVIAGTEEPDAEVELSAQDLRELSDLGDNDERGCGLMKRSSEPLPRTTTTVPSVSALQMPAAPTRISSFSLSLALAIGAIGALYLLLAPSDDASQSSTQNILERVPQSEWSEAGPRVDGEPVLFANPFDAHEMFEFPPGTSEAEARDAVAEVLMKRAMERQHQFDARVSRNH